MQQHTLLDEAKAQFDHWRTTRSKRGKIPEYLWDKVKPLIDRYPLTAITNALSLNSKQIRENLNVGTSINFFEVKTESLTPLISQQVTSLCTSTQTCSIELHRVNGGVLKISAIPVASLPAIITQFMV